MSPLVLVALFIGGCVLVYGAEKLPNNPSSSERLKRSAARHPRDVPLSSYGRLGEREDDNATTITITTTTPPEVETTEYTQSSTEIKQETTTPQTNSIKGPFGFEFNLPTGIFQSKGPEKSENKPSGQPAEGAPATTSGFQLQAPKLQIPTFGFGRK